MSARKLTIVNLYPQQLSLYGDTGNLLVIKKRAEWRAIETEVIHFELGADLQVLASADIIFGGGGQDSGQLKVASDWQRITPTLKRLVEAGVPMLTICASYQLFGSEFITSDGVSIVGADIFDVRSECGSERQIGNAVALSDDFGELIGYENHGGVSVPGDNFKPLAKTVNGFGNNGKDGTEGARYLNALGTYLHGPLLPKNPQVADFLIAQALENRFGVAEELAPLPSVDVWVEPAREVARNRPR